MEQRSDLGGALKGRPVFAVFEGGGAKGIAHIGALRALEDGEADIQGVAGTSAGAIMAVLSAAGFEAAELFDHENKTTLFGNPDFPFRKVTDVLGANAWLQLRVLRATGAIWAQAMRGGLGFIGLALAVIALAWCTQAPAWAVLVGLFASIGLLALFVVGLACLGMVSLQQLRKNLNLILRWKCSQQQQNLPANEKNPALEALIQEGSSEITFAQAKALGWKPIKIVASNITQGRIEVFSEATTPHVSLADAVAASICIPILFRAIHLKPAAEAPHSAPSKPSGTPLEAAHHSYVDGGMLSNLPAWVFEEERCLNPDAAVIAVELEAPPATTQAPNRLSGLAFLGALVRTAIFGAGALSKRVRGLLIPLQLTPLKRNGEVLQLLEFDVDTLDAQGIISDAHTFAMERLVDQLVRIPSELREFTEGVRALFLNVIADEDLGSLFQTHGKPAHVRVAIATRPRNHLSSWKLHDGAGFDDSHPDREIYLPDPGSLVAKAVARGRATLATKATLDNLCQEGGLAGQTLQANGWSELCWSIAIPYSNGQTSAALVIDSNAELMQDEAVVEQELDLVLQSIQTEFDGLQQRIEGMEPR
nr:patatin-like phospholipase family protein [Oceanococcus sp. HetDA_MAG_MS8]